MNLGFWSKLEKPIWALAPMANVTDPAFRKVIARLGKPDVFWTEFVSADGLALTPEEGRRKLLKDLEYSSEEHPIVAQFFTSNPEHMESAARLAQELGFDGVDINMGCPDRSIEKQGAGAALIRTPELAQEIIRSAKRGAGLLPVSVKTRLGYNKDILEEWLPALLSAEPVAVTLHARTRKEMSKVPAHWERVTRAVEIRDSLQSQTLILGNGDVMSLGEAEGKVEETGADGVMMGKAIFGNPWLFKDGYSPNIEERLEVLVEHTKLFQEILGGYKNFAVMKKHFKSYVTGFDGASDLRAELMDTNTAEEVGEVVNKFLLDWKDSKV